MASPTSSTSPQEGDGIVGRLRRASTIAMNATPQLGMWQATGTAIAQAPNLTELRGTESGGANIQFNVHGHSARVAAQKSNGEIFIVQPGSPTARTQGQPAWPEEEEVAPDAVDPSRPASAQKHPEQLRDGQELPGLRRQQTLLEKHQNEPKENWVTTMKHALHAFWKFFLTPSGFCITIYFLNIVVRIPIKDIRF